MKNTLLTFVVIFFSLNQNGLADQNYIRFAPKNGGFSIEFPNIPKEYDVPNSPPKEARTYQLSNYDHSYSQTVHYRNLTKEFLDKFTSKEILDQMRDAGLERNDAKIAQERNINISSHIAKDILYTRTDGGQTRARYVINKGRFYAVIVTATKEYVANKNIDLKDDQPSNKFLISFKLEDFN